MGWVFALQVYPDDGINELSDWVARWSKLGVVIKDEYGKVVTPEEMLRVITERSRKPWEEQRQTLPWGHLSWAEFHKQNSSVEGPNGLLRCREGVRGVRHGHGTYDLHTGEFS